jgi:hypothetical protein
MEPCYHDSLQFANQVLNWAQFDTYDRYQANLQNQYAELEKYGWIDQSFTYQFNSHGFRCDEFDQSEPSVMFLGCSHVVGVGLPIESTLSYIISKQLNFKNHNLGVAGGANDTAFRLADYYIPRLTPKIVIFLSTERTRFELFTNENYPEILTVNRVKNSLAPLKPGVEGFYRYWITNTLNTEWHDKKNVLAIKQLCAEHNIKFYHHEFLKFQLLDKARDLAHFGVRSNNTIAQSILSKL